MAFPHLAVAGRSQNITAIFSLLNILLACVKLRSISKEGEGSTLSLREIYLISDLTLDIKKQMHCEHLGIAAETPQVVEEKGGKCG